MQTKKNAVQIEIQKRPPAKATLWILDVGFAVRRCIGAEELPIHHHHHHEYMLNSKTPQNAQICYLKSYNKTQADAIDFFVLLLWFLLVDQLPEISSGMRFYLSNGWCNQTKQTHTNRKERDHLGHDKQYPHVARQHITIRLSSFLFWEHMRPVEWAWHALTGLLQTSAQTQWRCCTFVICKREERREAKVVTTEDKSEGQKDVRTIQSI